MNIEPKINTYILQMENEGLLSSGLALELGCGYGNDTLFIAKKRYQVTAVDFNKDFLKELEYKKGNLSIEIVHQNIENFVIEKAKYSLIIANNVLPFIKEKAVVEQIIKNMSEGLLSGGKMYLTLFGPKDAWFGKPKMSFFEYSEATDIFKKLDLELYHQSTEEGYGKMMNGESKFWNIHRFLYVKK